MPKKLFFKNNFKLIYINRLLQFLHANTKWKINATEWHHPHTSCELKMWKFSHLEHFFVSTKINISYMSLSIHYSSHSFKLHSLEVFYSKFVERVRRVRERNSSESHSLELKYPFSSSPFFRFNLDKRFEYKCSWKIFSIALIFLSVILTTLLAYFASKCSTFTPTHEGMLLISLPLGSADG